MPGLVPGIHVFRLDLMKSWMAGTQAFRKSAVFRTAMPGRDEKAQLMHTPKILVLPGSNRTGSHNVRLAALAAKELTLRDVDVTRISLVDYPLPIYEADIDARSGQPEQALLGARNESAT